MDRNRLVSLEESEPPPLPWEGREPLQGLGKEGASRGPWRCLKTSENHLGLLISLLSYPQRAVGQGPVQGKGSNGIAEPHLL